MRLALFRKVPDRESAKITKLLRSLLRQMINSWYFKLWPTNIVAVIRILDCTLIYQNLPPIPTFSIVPNALHYPAYTIVYKRVEWVMNTIYRTTWMSEQKIKCWQKLGCFYMVESIELKYTKKRKREENSREARRTNLVHRSVINESTDMGKITIENIKRSDNY